MHKIATVISYCTNDFRYLKKCIQETKRFSNQVIVPVCDHFYNGEKEDTSLMQWGYKENPEAEFVEFAYYKEKLYSKFIECAPDDKYWNLYWNGISRYIGFLHVQKDCDYVLFLDADEIADGQKFLTWLDHNDYHAHNLMRFMCFLYFRGPEIQSTTFQKLPILIRKDAMRPLMALNVDDRHGIFARISKNVKDKILGPDKLPMFHHYSWVRTKEECLKKTNTWGHWWEKDWEKIIEEEYSHEFNGKDFVFDHEYIKVNPFFNPFRIKIPIQNECPKDFLNVQKVNYDDILKKELFFEFGII